LNESLDWADKFEEEKSWNVWKNQFYFRRIKNGRKITT
jgi:hypothetical protein